MKNLLYFFAIFYIQVALSETNISQSPSSGISYKLLRRDQHNIHVLNIDPKYFSLDIIKARNQVIGRETVESIALRKNAAAAINAGFFEIGNSEDGRPSLTLIIKGKIFGLGKKAQGLLIIDQEQLQVTKALTKISIHTKQKDIVVPSQVNHILKPSDITLYTDAWGNTTLTPYHTREIIIDSNSKVIDLCNHGDNAIPAGGFVLSFSPNRKLPLIQKGDNLNIALELIGEKGDPIKIGKTPSVVTGIPILVKDGHNIHSNNPLSSSHFHKNPHARTAIGLQADGTVVIVVAEHAYKHPIKELKLQQVKELLSEEANIDIKTLTIPQVMEILEKRLAYQETVGLTIPELSDLMVSLGCESAINLDGGGSSTMFMDNKIVNQTTGDQDEALGKNVARPVSDAIIITHKSKATYH